MGNYIKVAARHSISMLFRNGWSQRRIARELGIDRKTVGRYIARELSCEPKGAIPTAGKPGRKSQCEPYRKLIEEKLDIGLSAQRIFQDLRYDYGYHGSYEAVKRFVRRFKTAHPQRVYRIESPPGEEAQVDFGRGAPIKGTDGRRKITHVFRVVLSYSRKAYSESVLHQTTEIFIRCLENAFRAFGGVPKSISLDNLKAAVSNADWYDPELHPKIEEFGRYYGTVFLPTRPYTPQDKGKVESGVKYVKNNALKGRVFSDLEEENKFLSWWEETIADHRIHGTTRKQVGELFRAHEKQALLPLPSMLFPCFQEGQRTVHRDGYVEVARSYYEVPEEYIGRRVWVRWDSRLVRVFNKRFEQIAVLARISPGKFSSCLSTRGRRISIERTVAYWLKRAGFIGDNAGSWAFEIVNKRGPQGIRVLQGLAALTKKHHQKDVDKACELALAHGAYRLRDLRRLISKPSRQNTFEFLDSHPLIRDISEYETFLRTLEYDNRDPFKKEVI